MSTNTDLWSGVPARLLLSSTKLGGAADLVGSIAGWAQKPADQEQLKDYQKNKAMSFIPGVGAYRIARRRRVASKGDFTPIAHEIAGGVVSSLALVVAGALGGYALMRSNRANAAANGVDNTPLQHIGALVGGGAGVIASALALGAGSLTAQLKKRRTKQQQQKADTSGTATALKYLLPGYAAYSQLAGARSVDAV